MKKDVTTIKQTVIIPNATPKQVYDAYTDPKKHTQFTGSEASGKPVVGGKYSAWDNYIFGTYLALDEGKSVVQEWMTSDWKEGYPASKLELTFKAIPEGTEITLHQTGVPKVQAAEFEQGWIDFYWDPLKAYFKRIETTPKHRERALTPEKTTPTHRQTTAVNKSHRKTSKTQINHTQHTAPP